MLNEMQEIVIKKPNQRVPLILKKKIILQKKKLLPLQSVNGRVSVKVLMNSSPIQEDVLYESKPGDFLSKDDREVVIINKYNKVTHSVRTIAKCISHTGHKFEKTSDEITNIIGQSNYDTLFTALCSIINTELKIRGIYSLLTVPKSKQSFQCQTDQKKLDDEPPYLGGSVDVYVQTTESYMYTYNNAKMRRKAKRPHPSPYVVREATNEKKVKKLVIQPSNFSSILQEDNNHNREGFQKEESTFPDLGMVFDEDSNLSVGKFSTISIETTPELMKNPISMIMANVDKVTENNQKDLNVLHDFDSGKIVNEKPVPLNQMLQSMPQQQRVKMLIQQGLFDFHNCLQRDASDHLPIHAAVLTNDIDLLKRQCLVLKIRDISVDIKADNLTPLKMTLYQDSVEMTSLLLQYNADVMDSDAQDQTYFHIAAEKTTEHLQILVNHCRLNARSILEENEGLWKSGYELKSDKELASILLGGISTMTNDQGYTPLMLASKWGIYPNVQLLIECCQESVNMKMPNSGNTALYIAVGAACMDCAERGNKSKVVDHFKKTIEILVDNGADTHAKNFDGASINDLLTDYNIADLSMVIANKMTNKNIGDGQFSFGNKIDNFMLLKDQAGNVDIKKIENDNKHYYWFSEREKSTVSKKPVIVKTESIVNNSISPTRTPQKRKINILSKNNTKVQNFVLNKPIILKKVSSKKKSKLEIYDPNQKN